MVRASRQPSVVTSATGTGVLDLDHIGGGAPGRDRKGARAARAVRPHRTDPGLVFHSIRHTVVTMLEEAGVMEATVASITGHSYPTMTFGLYSGGVSLARKAEALAKLAY